FMLVAGVVGSALFGGLEIVAPAYNPHVQGAPPMLPFLFITIACGAISGFHALVGSGTTSKQVEKEPDAQFVGYGSMLLEAALATLVIIAVAAGIGMAYETTDGILTGSAAWNKHYASWAASRGLGTKITAMVVGSANMMETVGIPKEIGIVLIGVFIASFAGTTLDSAARIQRYVVSEVASDLNIKIMTRRFPATAFAVITAAWLAFSSGATGKGALKIWPMFGAANQLLAALTLIVATVFLKRRTRYGWLVAGVPAVVMLAVTLWAVFLNEINFITGRQWSLAVINASVMALSLWIVVESIAMLKSSKLATPQR
ncbi:MAG: carbon starvation CstA family protein, partial [Verrucomicrobiota bacterium]